MNPRRYRAAAQLYGNIFPVYAGASLRRRRTFKTDSAAIYWREISKHRRNARGACVITASAGVRRTTFVHAYNKRCFNIINA